MCETCGGWHPTEAHAQHEKEAREKRMAEIKARPDSAYSFNVLDFEQEKRDEVEPWMHTVIEKAKDLGDDLQDSDFYIHFGPIEGNKKFPSVFSMLTQDSFTRGETFVAYFEKGTPMKEKAMWSGASRLNPILELQERWVKTRKDEDLQKYQEAIRATLNDYVSYVEQRISETADDGFKNLGRNRIENAQKLLTGMDSTEGRREAMDFITQRVIMGGTSSRNNIGVIFSIGDSLQQRTTSEIKRHYLNLPYSSHYTTSLTYKYNGNNVLFLNAQYGGGFEKGQDRDNLNIGSAETEHGKKFYIKFIHSLYSSGGSVKVQKELLQRMLEMTKDQPDRRLPIYNFYGKLVWPRPPEEKK